MTGYVYGASDPAKRPKVGAHAGTRPGRPTRPDVVIDNWGNVLDPGAPPEARGMTAPVRCRCGDIYDLGTVTVTSRYYDCSMWRTPCCDVLVDDRPPGLVGIVQFTRLRKVP